MSVAQLKHRVVRNDHGCSQSVSSIDWLAVTTAISNGSECRFDVFYDATFALMYRQARRHSGRDESTCMDIVQEAMLKAIRSMKPIDSWNHLAAWSVTVARSATYDWLRSELSRQNALQQAMENREAASTDDSTMDLQARMTWVQEKLQAAEPELRRLISLRYRTGWTLERIANKVGMKTGAVDGRIRRAIASLKQQAELEYEED